MSQPLGQHWLSDRTVLAAVAEAAGVTLADTVLEIGPGLGSLSTELIKRAQSVVAVELDPQLAKNLQQSFTGSKLEVREGDILRFDLSQLPEGYKVAANLPYYITAPILQHLAYSSNPPGQMGLLVQKEVAQRLAALSGDLSVLAISVQNRYRVAAGVVVPARLFSPPPKVDSQVVSLKRLSKPQFGPAEPHVIKLVKAGFANRRKTLINSLHSILGRPKPELSQFLKKLRIAEDVRAQELTLRQWKQLYNQLYN